VAALQALRGVSFVTAVGLVAEVATSGASTIRATSWRFWASCRRSTRVDPAFKLRGAPLLARPTRMQS
jgi:hypothetical protein